MKRFVLCIVAGLAILISVILVIAITSGGGKRNAGAEAKWPKPVPVLKETPSSKQTRI